MASEKGLAARKSSNDNQESFRLGAYYKFKSSFKTYCIPINGDRWVKKVFERGTCWRREPDAVALVFRGSPVDENEEYEFLLKDDGNLVARGTLPPYIRVVETTD